MNNANQLAAMANARDVAGCTFQRIEELIVTAIATEATTHRTPENNDFVHGDRVPVDAHSENLMKMAQAMLDMIKYGQRDMYDVCTKFGGDMYEKYFYNKGTGLQPIR